jgi:hypothetical protein
MLEVNVVLVLYIYLMRFYIQCFNVRLARTVTLYRLNHKRDDVQTASWFKPHHLFL